MGRSIGVVILDWVDPALVLSFYAAACSSFAISIALVEGRPGVGSPSVLFFFESICYLVSIAFVLYHFGDSQDSDE